MQNGIFWLEKTMLIVGGSGANLALCFGHRFHNKTYKTKIYCDIKPVNPYIEN
jgi:hypothetical protein